MSSQSKQSWMIYIVISILFASLLPACRSAGGGDRIWIDDPLDGDRLPVETVVVYSTASSSAGVSEITLLVDGDPVRVDAPGEEGDLLSVSQPWDPPGSGSYQLQVEMTTDGGETFRSRKITVQIGDITPTAADTLTPTATETLTPTPTVTLTPTAANTPVPPVSLNFNADSYRITRGECTTLRWRAEYAEEVVLDGAAVSLENARDVCPSDTTTYQLTASNAAGEETVQLTVEVQAPAGPPAAPQNVSIEDRVCSSSAYTVTVGWFDAADHEDGYRLYREGELIAELSANAESFQDEPPGSGPYTYAVEAYNSSGSSQRVSVEEEGCLY
jgi:hypothetical protein